MKQRKSLAKIKEKTSERLNIVKKKTEMIKRIDIQNYKSLKQVCLDNLQRVNLLIGPNNSGKSNVLKAIAHFFGIGFPLMTIGTLRDSFQGKGGIVQVSVTIKKKYDALAKDLGGDHTVYTVINNFDNGTRVHSFQDAMKTNEGYDTKPFPIIYVYRPDIDKNFDYYFSPKYLPIYKPNIAQMVVPVPLAQSDFLANDAGNIITFLYTLSTNHKKMYRALEADLERCLGDLVEVTTPPINTTEGGRLSLKFFDKEGNDYAADEVSDGVLYFLALLCIIHQPNPPKILLLEEPERGIHPRRISEVMNFIFGLAEEKDIQVIMTSHSPEVLNEFRDLPEAVFIFDKNEEGTTQIKNLQKDVIQPSDFANEQAGLPKINFRDSIGEHWLAGFMGGVPL